MLEIRTGCRLHFGLMELAPDQPHRFAGLGLMVQSPCVRVRVGAKAAVDALRSGDDAIASRVQATAAHAERSLDHRLPDGWSIGAAEHPRLHSGLGLGTQLGAAVAAAAQLASIASRTDEHDLSSGSQWRSVVENAELAGVLHENAAARDPSDIFSQHAAAEQVTAEQVRGLARLSGRGKRSAVGLHGFLFGGLVQDLGQSPGGHEPPQRTFGTRSCAFPNAWPIVLLLSTEGGDMCGAVEEQLMCQAGAAPNGQRGAMLALSDVCMSAAARTDFQQFAESLERYMDIAATLFASVQAGPYRNERIAQRVALAQRAGLRGVGQSSWGPTVFGFADNHASAEQVARDLRAQLRTESVEVIVTRAANQGASWRQIATGVQHAS